MQKYRPLQGQLQDSPGFLGAAAGLAAAGAASLATAAGFAAGLAGASFCSSGGGGGGMLSTVVLLNAICVTGTPVMLARAAAVFAANFLL